MNVLRDKLLNRESGIVLYSLTPPEKNISLEKLSGLNKRRTARIKTLNCDGLSIYDVQEEKGRDSGNRTFQYREAMNPLQYSHSLNEMENLSKVLYLVTGKYSEKELQNILENSKETSFVLVGSSEPRENNKTDISKAFPILSSYSNPLGAVCIGERYRSRINESERMLSKIKQGADFFISQCVYDLEIYDFLLKEYKAKCEEQNILPRPLILTFSPVGTEKAVDFMKWLGVRIPKTYRRGLKNCENPLDYSIQYLEEIARSLFDLCFELNIPVGVNFESVIARRDEVLASLSLADRVSGLLKDKLRNNNYNQRVPLTPTR